MFYYKITKTTRAVPNLVSNEYAQFGSQRHAGDRAADLIGSGYYGKVVVEAVSQAAYVRATRGE